MMTNQLRGRVAGLAFALGTIATAAVVGATQRQTAPSKAPATNAAPGQIGIEVGLVLQSGSVHLVPRTEFQLVRKSVAALLLQTDPEGLSHSNTPGLSNEDTEVNTYCMVQSGPRGAAIIGMGEEKRLENVKAAVPLIKKSLVQVLQTDFAGKAAFTNLPAGNYWVFGCYEWNQQGFAWNVPVRVNAGEKKTLILDQNNATNK